MPHTYTALRETITAGDLDHDTDHETLHSWYNYVWTEEPYDNKQLLKPVRVVSTANIALSATQTVDSVSLGVGDRVLVMGQTASSENGIYEVQTGAWTRTDDMDADGNLIVGALVAVQEGTNNAGTLYICTATGADPWVAGTSSSTWEAYSSTTGGGGVDENVISVTDYGAIGDGTADDTAAFIAARDALIASAATSASGRIKYDLFVPEGTYKITSADALLYDGMPYIRGLKIRGQGKRRSIIRFETGLGTPATNFDNNLATVNGNMNYVRIEGLTFESNNPNHTAFMFYSSNTEPVQDIGFYDCEWSGSWKRGLCFDGPGVGGDHNSEIQFFECATVNISTYTEAFLEVQPDGGDAGGDGSDQAVNFFFTNCKFELESGDILRFTRGGSVHIWGGSWLYTDTDPSNTSKMIVLGNPTYYTGPGAKQFSMQGVRTELRGEGQMLLDHYWGGGGTAPMVTLSNVSTYYSAYGGRGEQQMITIHGQPGGSASFGTLRIRDCDLYGHILVDRDVPQDRGVVIVEGSLFYNFVDLTNPVGISTDTTKPLRYVTGRTIPAHVFRNVYRISDVSVPGAGDGTLAGLTDTSINTPTSGQVLSYNGSAWANSEVDASVFKEYYVIATPDASTAEKEAADYTLPGTGTAAALASKISTERQVYLVGNTIELDTYLEVQNANNVQIKSDGVEIVIDDARSYNSAGAYGTAGFVLYGSARNTIGGTGPAAALSEGNTVVTVGTGHGVNVGDWLILRGDTTDDNLNTNRRPEYVKSEFHRVIAVTSTTITLETSLVYSYSNHTSVAMYYVTPAVGIELNGLKFSYPSTGTIGEVALVSIGFADSPVIRNCSFSGYDATKGANVKAGLALTTCRGATVENCYVEYIDDSDQGYGIYVNGSTDTLIDRLRSYRCRHVVDAGQQWTTATVPRYMTVSNSVAYSSFEAAWGSHGAEYCTFRDNVALSCSGAIHVRGKNTIIDGLTVLGLPNAQAAIVLGETDGTETVIGGGSGATNVRITNTFIDTLVPNTGSGYGIGVYAPDPVINSHLEITARVEDFGFDIRGNVVENSYIRFNGFGINSTWLNGHANPAFIKIQPNTGATATQYVSNNHIECYADHVPYYAVYVYGDSNNTTSSDNNHYKIYAQSVGSGTTYNYLRFDTVNAMGDQYVDEFYVAGQADPWAQCVQEGTATVYKPTYSAVTVV